LIVEGTCTFDLTIRYSTDFDAAVDTELRTFQINVSALSQLK